MPALEFGKFAEGWHTAVGIAISDFPEETAVGLGLDFGNCKVGGFFEACAGGAMAFGAMALEEFCAACCGVFVFGERIFAGGGLVWCAPGWILLVAGVLGDGCASQEQEQIPQG